MTESPRHPLDDLERSIAPEAMITAFLHDPPDKALDIRGHEERATRYLRGILDDGVDRDGIKGDSALGDQLAAVVERLVMPKAGAEGQRAVGPAELMVHHPLGGAKWRPSMPSVAETATLEKLKNLCSGIDDRRALFRLLWRLLPEKMAELDPAYAFLPADTRIPDHTIWHHADAVAAFSAATYATGKGDYALLSFALSPVQSFIAAARSLRDLRNGSILLSWLCFRALQPILERIGPTALIFPNLRGNALMDVWLRKAGGLGNEVRRPENKELLSPSLPNRFLALVPMGLDGAWAEALATACEQAARAAWTEVAEAVRNGLNQGPAGRFQGWDANWAVQIDQAWDFTATILPIRQLGSDEDALPRYFDEGATFEQVFPDAAKLRAMAAAIPAAEAPGYRQAPSVGRWQMHVELAARFLESARSVRKVPIPGTIIGEVAAKCTLLGTWEQMGPGNRDAAKQFWGELSTWGGIAGARIRSGEALSAIGLVKRFAMGAHLADQLDLRRDQYEPADGGFPDTATLAARRWFHHANVGDVAASSERSGWNGQWLHWSKRDLDKDEVCPPGVWAEIVKARASDAGPPPAYYAVLMLDGDDMGEWLRGAKSPRVKEALHPKTAAYFDGLKDARPGLNARRSVTPSLHAAISEALGNYAQFVVPEIIGRHSGELIYAGGDDVLALLPTETAVVCAHDLERAFRGDPDHNDGAPAGYYRLKGRDLLMMGPQATVSVGIAVVHYKEDLRAALDMARRAEKAAKSFGKDAVGLTVARRSGEHANVSLPWDLVTVLAAAVEAFREGASDRWTYRLRQLLPVYQGGGLPEAAFIGEIRRQLKRGDDKAEKLFWAVDFYEKLRDAIMKRNLKLDPIESFVTLWQSASFLARGRDW